MGVGGRREQCKLARARKASRRQRGQPSAEPGFAGRETKAVEDVRAVALIDGEHYVSVVRDALAALPYDVVGAILVGGTEKLRGGEDYGVPLVDDFEGAEVVVDLSDEPVLGPAERLRWAARSLAVGLPYVGSDFRFDPPSYAPFELPSLAVIGTGKRVGKTAVSGHVARLLARDREVVVVAMGRGGPAQPEIADVRPTADSLLELSRSGRHAASDYLEIAALSGVVTVGCRRAGGGLAGQVFESNVLEGARLAAGLRPDFVLFDGSGAAIPPVDVDRRILVARTDRDATAYLNPYRVLVSDLVVLVGDGDPEPIRELKDVPVVRVDLRLAPVEPLAGRRTAVFTTGPAPTDHLDADIVLVSRNLANRELLREDLATVKADVYLVEIKAAAIDVVAEAARERGVEVVFAANDVVARAGEADLDAELLKLVEPAVRA
jgi:cyclic 2,3-diphosphoglycerate synthetase